MRLRDGACRWACVAVVLAGGTLGWGRSGGGRRLGGNGRRKGEETVGKEDVVDMWTVSTADVRMQTKNVHDDGQLLMVSLLLI